MQDSILTAFALAGLGGFNAHGAGFLTAVNCFNEDPINTRQKVTPGLVTATSGQILVLAGWLQGDDLRKYLINPGHSNGLLATLMLPFTGLRDVFRPAVYEYWKRIFSTPLATDINGLAGEIFPAQEFVPLRSQEFFEKVAKVLNDGTLFIKDNSGNIVKSGVPNIGVVFNALNVSTGEELLFGNDVARKLIQKQKEKLNQKSKHTLLDAIDLKEIDAEAVRSALWLSLYGFDDLPGKKWGGLVDGAYKRCAIIAELHKFGRIYAALPISKGWGGKVPESWFDIQDWQTEMWFSDRYDAEVAAMNTINKLVDNGVLNDPDYKHCDLIEIRLSNPCGYFNFFSERDKVFDDAFQSSMELLQSV